MPVTFKVPKSPAKSIYKIDQFKGVDFSNSPINVDDNKSPNSINMIRDVPDKVRKRMGYEIIQDFADPSSYVNNYCDIVFPNQSYIDEYDTGGGWSVSTDELYVNHFPNSQGEHKLVNLVGVYNDFVNAGHRVPESGSTLDIKLFEFDLPQGSYKMTYFWKGGKIIQTRDYEEGAIHTVPTSLTIGGVSDEIELSYENYNQKHTISITQETTGKYEFHLKLPDEKVSFDGFFFGVNVIADDKYNENLPYIPSGSNIPNDWSINGCHYRREDEYPIYHIGTDMIQNGTTLYSGANNALSHSWQLGDSLYILDGKKLLVYDGTTLQPVQSIAYVPRVVFNKNPDGTAGEFKEDYNLVGTAWEEGFCVTPQTASAKSFYLARNDLDATAVTAKVMNAQGNLVDKVEGTDFTVDRTNGIVTFGTAPGASPVDGQDNVFITAYKTIQEDLDQVNKCTFGIRFGVNGAFDRLFVSGNPDYPNADWHSQMWDGTYFPDTSYAILGSQKSAVVGYSIISNYLAAHKDEMEEDLAVIIREGDMIDDEPSFRIINTLQGQGAIATNSFKYLSTEPIFLTRSGLYAITAQDITGEKYSQSRSFYLNGKLCAEDYDKLKDSVAIVYNDMYLLSVDHDRLYVLDGLQPMRTDKSEPYATRQYAAFYCDNLPINSIWERENRLYFGTKSGKICRFFNDKDDINSYNDAGEPIYCCWETPDIDGQLFYKNKSLRYVAIRVGSALATSVKIYAMERGIWKFIKQDNTFARYFSFENLQFSKFAFSGNKTPQISRTKLRIKRVDKYRLRFVNEELNEPFTLYNIANEYTESGNYKG